MEFFGDNGMESLQTMGIINALKTGNVHFDMILAMIIPVAFGYLFSSLDRIKQDVLKYMDSFFQYRHPTKKIYQRYIRHSKVTHNYYSNSQNETQNETLIKAILLYLDHHHILKLQNANMELQSIQKQNTQNYYWYDNDETKSVADTLQKYKVIQKPITNEWVPLEATSFEKCMIENPVSNMEMIIEEHQTNVDNGNDMNPSKSKTEFTLHFRSENENSIDQFIDIAYKWYLNELKKLEDNSRYLYELIDPTVGDDESCNCAKYKKYQLSDEKTFQSLFFQEKDAILKLVNHFTNKTGKYAIQGYPHKLGLLLHGPPGTGKTSLIKALAQLTGRSIVNVPLARISTNAQLASLFFDQKYYIEGEQIPIQLSFKDIIFVMEDVDAVSKVVRRRDEKKTNNISYPNKELELKPIWRLLLESRNETCKELVKNLKEKSPRLKKYAQDPDVLISIARRMTALPNLSLVGETTDNQTIQKIADQAVTNVTNLMEQYDIVDNFIASHAEVLQELLDSDAEWNESFENELLGISEVSSTSQSESFSSMIPKQQGVSGETSDTSHLSDDSEDYFALTSNNICDDNLTDGGKNSNKMQLGPKFLRHHDELNLSGLLNVLDGVVDTPGRMLVMTTNHPEMLDPALIRPGRIDKKLLLGYMSYADVLSMIEHFFQTKIHDDHCKRLRLAINGEPKTFPLRITPAEIEQMAAENDKVEDMISALEKKRYSTMLANTHGFTKI